ncbi:MAG: hypothetical protein ABF379_00430 [Akkermansiaceae bacterium]
MKLTLVILLTIFAGGLVFAAPPTVHRSDRYKDLYLKSAITDPPPPAEVEEVPGDLGDWILVAVSKYVGKTEVEVMNIKDRTRVRIPGPDATELGFEIKEVKQSRNFIEETVVVLKKGKETDEIGFDPKFLVLKKAAGPSTAKGRPSNSKDGKSQGNRPPTPSRPPIPGRSSSNTKSDKSSKSGSTGSRVPLPSTSTTSTKSSGSSSQQRVRFVKPKK